MTSRQSVLTTLTTFEVLFILLSIIITLTACGGNDTMNQADHQGGQPGIDRVDVGDLVGEAHFKYSIVVVKAADGREIEVNLNGLPLYKLNGGRKVEGTTWEIIQRVGVRMSDIFTKAGIKTDRNVPINLIGGDGFDPLRGKYKNDVTRLPHADFMMTYAYIYSGNPGNKHPGYPDIGSDGLMVDYDLANDRQVPDDLGGTLAALSVMRMNVMEKADPNDYGRSDLQAYYGIIEIDPSVTVTDAPKSFD